MYVDRSIGIWNYFVMRTRISRTGKPQVLLGVWIDKSVYDELESTAKSRETTVADVIRNLLARSVETERYRPDAEQILNELLSPQRCRTRAAAAAASWGGAQESDAISSPSAD